MSLDLVITPPSTPNFDEHEACTDSGPLKEAVVNGIDEVEELEAQCFICQGKADENYKAVASSLQSNSLYLSSDCDLFLTSTAVCLKKASTNSIQRIQLFNHTFDKGSLLLEETDFLFQNLKKTLYQLKKSAKAHAVKSDGGSIKNDGINHKKIRSKRCYGLRRSNGNSRPAIAKTKVLDHEESKRQIIRFCFYVRNYLKQLLEHLAETAFVEEIILKLVQNLSSLHSVLGHLTDCSDYILDSDDNTSPKCHLYHAHLNLQWLSLTILYSIVIIDQHLLKEASSKSCLSLKPSFLALKSLVHELFSYLVQLSLLKYKSVDGWFLLSSSPPINCSCDFQLWVLLYRLSSALHNNFNQKSFWDQINEHFNVFGDPVDFESQRTQSLNPCETLDGLVNPFSYVFWMVTHLTRIFKETTLVGLEFESNYVLVERTLKKCLADKNLNPLQLRQCLSMMESLVIEYWEPNSSIVLILWEHFQNKLDDGFFLIPGENFEEQCKPSESALCFLNQIQEIIEDERHKGSTNLSVYKQFLRLLGLHLRRTKDTNHFWNRIKGRIFSKFSVQKINEFTEPGLHNFLSLFLILGITGDVGEVSRVFTSLISEVQIPRNFVDRRKVLWKGYLALLLVNLERNVKIDSFTVPMLKFIEEDITDTECEHIMPIFFDAFQEMLIAPCGLKFGQLSLIDGWISHCLTRSSDLEIDSLLCLCSSLLCYLNSELLEGGFSVESDGARKEIWQLQIKFWNHLVPFLKSSVTKPTATHVIGEVLAHFINFSLKIGIGDVRAEKVKLLFKFVLNSESINLRVQQGFLTKLIEHDDALKTLASPQPFIQAWLKCCLLTEEKMSPGLVAVAEHVRKMSGKCKIFKNLTLSKGDVFIDFVKTLQAEYIVCSDSIERKNFRDEAATYLKHFEKWINEPLNNLNSMNEVLRIYERIGNLVSLAGPVIYIKSASRTLLHRLLDLLLLPQQVRDPMYSLHPFVAKALHNSLNLFIGGLIKLDYQNDPYISSTTKESLVVYLPKLVRKSGALNDVCSSFSLIKCFSDCQGNIPIEEDCCAVILSVVSDGLIKRRVRKGSELNFTLQALAFIGDIASVNRTKSHAIQCIIDHSLDAVSNVAMYYEKNDPCQKNAERLMKGILSINSVRTDPSLRSSALNLFSKLCKDHLAFYSFKLFDLFVIIATRAPELFKLFLPQLIEHVEVVEKKRGVTHDKSLRDKGIKRIDEVLSGG